MQALDDQQARYLVGPDFDGVVGKLGAHLAKTKLPIAIGQDAKIGDRIVLENDDTTRSVYVTPPVDYVFDRTGAQSNAYAWPGLSQYGPFDRTTFSNKSPRLLVAFPVSTQGKWKRSSARSATDLVPITAVSPRLSRHFRLVNVEFVMCPVQLSVSDRAGSEAAYRNAIEARLSAGEDVQGAIIVLFEEHAHLKGLQNPYLRTKALLLTLGIPAQEVRMPTVTQLPGSLQYTLQNFAVSVYAKLNGTPWTVNQDKAISDELVVGMGFAGIFRKPVRRIASVFVGITTVFSGDGTYLLGNVSKECSYADYPNMVRESMLSVLRELKTRNNWRPGDTVRVIFHAHRPLRRVDAARLYLPACARSAPSRILQMAFVTVSHDHPFYILDRGEKGEPIKRDSNIMKGAFAPTRRNDCAHRSSTRLLATNSGRLIKRANSPLPAPLLIHLHPDSTFKDVGLHSPSRP